MSLPNAFNTVADLLAFTSFEQGAGNGIDAVRDGTFLFSQFQRALTMARNEIYRKTGRKQNDQFDDDRLAELTESELWLATARLYRQYGERIALKSIDADGASVASVQRQPDTPPPSGPGSKGEFWSHSMANWIRNMGLLLLESPSTRYQVTVSTLSKNTTSNLLTDCECLSYGENLYGRSL